MIVAASEKVASYISELLIPASACQITAVKSCGEARRVLLERDFDLVVIDSPLRDETGESFALHVASKEITQVILTVKKEFYEAVSAICEREGVLTIAKPFDIDVFLSAVSLTRSLYYRMKKMQTENIQLRKKIEDIRIVDRAKCLLISFMKMTEKEAHRYIEKQAMDMRITKRAVAEKIIRTFEDL